jgi:hypothetical protein
VTLAERLRGCLAVLGAGRRAVVVVRVDDSDLKANLAAAETLVNVQCGPEGGPYACPCCASLTVPTRGQYESCPVCYWEDDGQDDHDADLVRLGPNGPLSLTQARTNYAAFGACDRTFLDKVRPPTAKERAAG